MTQIRELDNARTCGLVKCIVVPILKFFNLSYIIRPQIKMVYAAQFPSHVIGYEKLFKTAKYLHTG